MSTEKNGKLRARLKQRQSDKLNSIIVNFNVQIQEAIDTTLSLARYTFEKYVNDYIAKSDGNKIIIDVSTADVTGEDIKNLYGLLSKLFGETKENYSPTV